MCGTCHAVFAQKFATSVHAQIFERGCVECHGNHAVLKPSDEMLSTAPGAVCATCHEGPDDNGVKGAAAMRRAIERLKTALDGSSAVVSRVGNAGMEVGGQELTLAEARTHLTLARTELHGFDPPKVDAVIENGLKLVADVDRLAKRRRPNSRTAAAAWRCRWAPSCCLSGALALKMDRRRATFEIW